MARWLGAAAGAVALWIGGGALLHFAVFPEPAPRADDLPRRGTVARLPGGSTFVYRQTAAETDGAVFEAEWRGAPGAGTPRHTHPSQEEHLALLEGALLVETDGRERVLLPGEEARIPAGVEHRWANASDAAPARGIFALRPAGRADFVFVQLDRAFGGEAGPVATAVQTIVLIGTHGEHTAWPIEALRILLAPTARLLGIRSYYPPPQEPGPPAGASEPGSPGEGGAGPASTG